MGLHDVSTLLSYTQTRYSCRFGLGIVLMNSFQVELGRSLLDISKTRIYNGGIIVCNNTYYLDVWRPARYQAIYGRLGLFEKYQIDHHWQGAYESH